MAGRADESLPLLDRAAAKIDVGEGGSETRISIPLAEGYLAIGRLDAAATVTERALAAARARSERGYEAHALRLQGEIALHGGRDTLARADASLREALDRAQALGMRPLVARCLFGLGTVHRRSGRRDAALESFATAVEMMRQMDMAHWLPEAEGALAGASSTAATSMG